MQGIEPTQLWSKTTECLASLSKFGVIVQAHPYGAR